MRKQVLLRGGRQDGRVVSVKEDARTVEVTSIYVGNEQFRKGWSKDYPAGSDVAIYATTDEFEDDKEIFEWQS